MVQLDRELRRYLTNHTHEDRSMSELDLEAVQTHLVDEYQPTQEQYSIVLIDRRLPLSDSDCTTKGYETGDIRDFPDLPAQLDLSIVAIRDDGAVIELS